MLRYESEAAPDISAPSSRGHSFVDSEGTPNNFIALRQLKDADSQVDLMKRRLSALKIREEKNYRKSECAIKKIKYHQMIQDMEQRERERKRMYRIETQQKLESQKRLNSAERSSRAMKLREVRDMFQKAKQSQYRAEKEASSLMGSRIQKQQSDEL